MTCQTHELPTQELVERFEELTTRPGGIDMCVPCRRRLVQEGDNFMIRLLKQAQPELNQPE